jgi:hypothetical protein
LWSEKYRFEPICCPSNGKDVEVDLTTLAGAH